MHALIFMKWFHLFLSSCSNFSLQQTRHNLNWSFREVSYRSCKPAARERSRHFADSGAGRPKLRPGGLILHRFANGLLRCVRCAARVTNPLGVAADYRIGMPVGLDLASRSFLKRNALNFFWCSPFVVCAVDSWVLRRMWEQGCGWHTSVSQPQTWHGEILFYSIQKFSRNKLRCWRRETKWRKQNSTYT